MGCTEYCGWKDGEDGGAKGTYHLTYFLAVAPFGREIPTKYVEYVKWPPLLVVRISGPRPIDGDDPLSGCLDVWIDPFPPKEADFSLEGTRTLPAIFRCIFPHRSWRAVDVSSFAG